MTILRPMGIPVSLHPLLALLAVAVVGWQLATTGVGAAAEALALGGALFGSVLLHELGHALAARRVGVQTVDITLHPLGGVARLDRAPPTPAAELGVALAGPAVNLALAAPAAALWWAGAPLAGWFAAINVGMALFNLLPAWPLDGGRALRAAVSIGWGAPMGARVSATVARGIGWAMVAFGLAGAWNVALVGAFILVASGAERRRTQTAAAWTAPALPRIDDRFSHPTA